jgi:hypothetical protein
MKSLFNVTNKHLKTFLIVLFFGAVWGLAEAVIGTFVHLDLGAVNSSSAVMLPIAFYLMGLCYTKTKSLTSVLYIGLIAAAIKFSLVFVVGWIDKIYTPPIYIVAEALAAMGAIAVLRPTRVLSAKSFLTVAIAGTAYMVFLIVFKQIQGIINNKPFIYDLESWKAEGEEYLLTKNAAMLITTGVIGGISYGIMKLAEKMNWKFNKDTVETVLYNPITASVAVVVAVASTILFKLL